MEKIKILLVDDEKEFVRATKRLLELSHHRVEVAYDGQKGLRLAKKGGYDVILLDIMLPKIDGFKVAKKLRQRGVATPILMLTAKSMVNDRVKGLDSGADDFLSKPINKLELLTRVKSLLRVRHLKSELERTLSYLAEMEGEEKRSLDD